MTTAYWRRKERLYSFCGLELGLESSCFNPSQLRPIQELQSYTELQSYRATQSFRASNPSFEQRYENAQNTIKHRKTP